MSIRLRLTVVFTGAAAVLFSLGAWLFLTALSSGLLANIDGQLSTQLGLAGRYLASSSATPSRTSTSPLPGEYLVQVIDPSGTVRGASPDAGNTPLLGGSELRQAAMARVVRTASQEGERVRLAAEPLASHPGWAAVASVSLETYDRTRHDVFNGLLVGGLVFVAAAGLGAYGLARAAPLPGRAAAAPGRGAVRARRRGQRPGPPDQRRAGRARYHHERAARQVAPSAKASAGVRRGCEPRVAHTLRRAARRARARRSPGQDTRGTGAGRCERLRGSRPAQPAERRPAAARTQRQRPADPACRDNRSGLAARRAAPSSLAPEPTRQACAVVSTFPVN